MKKYNLSKPEKYVGKDGVEKTFWANVGTMTEFEKQDGTISRIVEIPAIGLKASVFLQVPRENAPQASQQRTGSQNNEDIPTIEYPEDTNEDGTPF
jgi:hypothetical protein